MQKHERDALRRLPGWEVAGHTNKGHMVLRHPETGATITLASSPGDNAFAKLLPTYARRAVQRALEARR